MLKKDDLIKWTPERGLLEGVELLCKVVETMRVFDIFTFQPVDRVIIEFELNGKKEQMALPLDAKYEIIEQN